MGLAPLTNETVTNAVFSPNKFFTDSQHESHHLLNTVSSGPQIEDLIPDPIQRTAGTKNRSGELVDMPVSRQTLSDVGNRDSSAGINGEMRGMEDNMDWNDSLFVDSRGEGTDVGGKRQQEIDVSLSSQDTGLALSPAVLGDNKTRAKTGTKRERSGKKSKAKRQRRDKKSRSSSNSLLEGVDSSVHSLTQQSAVSPLVSASLSVSSSFLPGNEASHSETPLPTPSLQYHHNTPTAESVRRELISQTGMATPISHLAVPTTSAAESARLAPEFRHIHVKTEPGLTNHEKETTRTPPPKVSFKGLYLRTRVVCGDSPHGDGHHLPLITHCLKIMHKISQL